MALVGTGPGALDLLTVRAADLLATADVIVTDEAVPGALLRAAIARDVEDTAGRHNVKDVPSLGREVELITVPADAPPADVVAQLVERAQTGAQVVRAYAGDPFVDGPAVRDALALHEAGLVFEVVPGVSPDVGVPGYAGVPVGLPRTVAVLGAGTDPDWAGLAAAPGTLVLLLTNLADLGKAAASFVEHGRSADTPVSVTQHGTTNVQRTVTSTLEQVEAELARLPEADPERVAAAGGGGPAVVVLGPGVAQRDTLSWWESRALYGWTVLVPRTREQAGTLSALLTVHGATPLEVPTIAVEPPRSPAQMDRAIRGLVSGRYQWVVFTSTNAVRAVREKVEEYGLDARAFAGVKVAAVGEVTAAGLRAWGINPDLVPSGQQSSEGLLADWPPYDSVLDPIDRVLLPRADIATETLVAGLQERGWEVDDVTAYRTVRAAPPPAPVREALKGGGVDAVLFTSSSTVRNLVGIAGKPHDSTVIAAIGPQTAATCAELGLRVDVQSSTPSVPALVQALAEFARARRAAQPEAGGTVTKLTGKRRRKS